VALEQAAEPMPLALEYLVRLVVPVGRRRLAPAPPPNLFLVAVLAVRLTLLPVAQRLQVLADLV